MSIPSKEALFVALANAILPYLKEKSKSAANAVIEDLFKANYFCFTQPHPGAMWISSQNGNKGLKNGWVISCYFHPIKSHMAYTKGSLGRKESYENGNKWAVSVQTKARSGNKTGYGTFDR